MPETEGFDLSNLASILQNEDTLRSLRQMAGAMGMENQLEGALQNLSQSQASASDTGAAASTASAQQDHPRAGKDLSQGKPSWPFPDTCSVRWLRRT